jgi:hypothetical protein
MTCFVTSKSSINSPPTLSVDKNNKNQHLSKTVMKTVVVELVWVRVVWIIMTNLVMCFSTLVSIVLKMNSV